nr:hypothetical protein [Tanacetum cinerariifolium]
KPNKKPQATKGKGKGKGKGKDKVVSAPKSKNLKHVAKEHPKKDDACHHYNFVCHWWRNYPVYSAKLMKKKHVGSANYGILVSKNDILYFKVIPRDGIYEIVMLNLVPNVNSIYNVSNKRAKHNLDSTYLWHYRLVHVRKERIGKLHHDGILKSTNSESFDQCVSCLSGKMTRKPFLQQTKRATDLLGLIRTDVCGPLRHVSRQESATRILSMVPTKKVDKTPYELWSVRTHRALKRLCLNVEVEEHSLGNLNEPNNYKAALLDPKSNKWLDAMNLEMQYMKENQVWRLADLPPNAKTVTNIRSVRILIAIATYYDYEIWKIEVKTAFLNGYLDEDIYMKIFDDEIKKFGFTQNLDETCVYRKASRSNVTLLVLYVDDIIIMGNHIRMLQDVKSYLGKCSAMKDLGETTFILGMKIYRDRSKRLFGLSQSAYMDKILKRFSMDNSKRDNITMKERLYLRCFYSRRGALDYKISKQSTTSKSTTKAEYIAALKAAMEAIWIRKFTYGLGIVPIINDPIKLYCKNFAALRIANEPGVQKGTRHYHRRLYQKESLLNIMWYWTLFS